MSSFTYIINDYMLLLILYDIRIDDLFCFLQNMQTRDMYTPLYAITKCKQERKKQILKGNRE